MKEPIFRHDRLYLNRYAVSKQILEKTFYLPILDKDITHRFHFAQIAEWERKYFTYDEYLDKKPDKKFMNETLEKRIKEYDEYLDSITKNPYINLIKENLEDEIIKNCPDPTKQKAYIFIEAIDNGKKLSPFYSILFMDDIEGHDQNSDENLKAFFKGYNDLFTSFILSENLHSSTLGDFFYFVHHLGDEIIDYFLYKDNEDFLNFPEISVWERRLNSIKEPALRWFLKDVINSFIEKCKKDKKLLRCEYCNEIMAYVKNKKYCSLSTEGRDCGKKARNKRHYEKNKNVILPKARKSTSELRKFYKEKGIKK